MANINRDVSSHLWFWFWRLETWSAVLTASGSSNNVLVNSPLLLFNLHRISLVPFTIVPSSFSIVVNQRWCLGDLNVPLVILYSLGHKISARACGSGAFLGPVVPRILGPLLWSQLPFIKTVRNIGPGASFLLVMSINRHMKSHPLTLGFTLFLKGALTQPITDTLNKQMKSHPLTLGFASFLKKGINLTHDTYL